MSLQKLVYKIKKRMWTLEERELSLLNSEGNPPITQIFNSDTSPPKRTNGA